MSIWLELLKLCAQLIGAIMVAKLAVQWALERFKSEKAWERQIAALTDVLDAMGTMGRVTKEWLSQYYDERQPTDDYEQALLQRHRSSMFKLQQVSATARLILPSDLANHISATEAKLLAIQDSPNYEEWLLMERDTLEASTDELVEMGRSIFDADARRPPDFMLQPVEYLKYRGLIPR